MQGDRCAGVSAVLVGRDRELGALRSLLDRTAAGRLSLAVVEGARGAGKTRLLQEFVGIAHRRGAATARETDWIDGSGMWRIVASGRDDGPSGPGVSAGPRLLTCEHPQWIHSRVWLELEAIARTVPLLVVLTRRVGASTSELDALAVVGPQRVVLGPLSGPAVGALLGSLVGGVPDAELRSLAEVAGGNPSAIEDLVVGLREEGLLRVGSGCAGVDEVRLPARTRARLDATLAGLAPSTRHLVQVASTIGARFDLRELAALLNRSAAALVPAVHEAIGSGLVVGVEDALRFRHELVRKTAEESLPRPVRAALRHERTPRSSPPRPHAAAGPRKAGATPAGPRMAGATPAGRRKAEATPAGRRKAETTAAGARAVGVAPAGARRGGDPFGGSRGAEGTRRSRVGSAEGAGGEGLRGGVEGWESLGEQERRIVGLVGCALTNQQIARRIERSPHTVNYHLRQIFRKLGVRSRVELARLARDYADDSSAASN
ncbi:BREX system ATP-binding domain-containing protein [Cryptosporangium sp. NPDC048952]|uniref:BREX system ATP-binding domain-containing protein n=1 Tax=Cryptosporangium sp. NPDC048952 TaxID=3363961 RepID=UPI003718A6C2